MNKRYEDVDKRMNKQEYIDTAETGLIASYLNGFSLVLIDGEGVYL